jgi:hypothetical protein
MFQPDEIACRLNPARQATLVLLVSPSTLTVYRQFMGPVHVNPNRTNFNDLDKLPNIMFQIQCIQFENI